MVRVEEVRESEVTVRDVELKRLREELIISRRSEAQKDRELVFVQQQLCEASARIASLMEEIVGSGAPNESKRSSVLS